ncbi:amidohydrolase family protein [Actinomadura sp. NAK00032]|uniref:amidohydrolase family protein n=1 Tax=Actinomadura sp. NAK00032 TaxID=2742128 RepID=UPI001C37C166|nr:amidohydrolase family protein [Actinomadura sp. NAK00032]
MVRHGELPRPIARCTIDSFGIDRILLGSDFPYFQNDLYTRAVRYVEEAGLTAEQVTRIFETNPAELLGLGGTAP